MTSIVWFCRLADAPANFAWFSGPYYTPARDPVYYYDDPSNPNQLARYRMNTDQYVLQGFRPTQFRVIPTMMPQDVPLYETSSKLGDDFEIILRGERVRIASREAAARTRAHGLPYVGWSAETSRPKCPILRFHLFHSDIVARTKQPVLRL